MLAFPSIPSWLAILFAWLTVALAVNLPAAQPVAAARIRSNELRQATREGIVARHRNPKARADSTVSQGVITSCGSGLAPGSVFKIQVVYSSRDALSNNFVTIGAGGVGSTSVTANIPPSGSDTVTTFGLDSRCRLVVADTLPVVYDPTTLRVNYDPNPAQTENRVTCSGAASALIPTELVCYGPDTSTRPGALDDANRNQLSFTPGMTGYPYSLILKYILQ